MTMQDDAAASEPPPTTAAPSGFDRRTAEQPARGGRWRRLIARLILGRGDDDVREAIEELIEEPQPEDGGGTTTSGIRPDERLMLHNILALRDCTVSDVMVPRVDIKAVQADIALAPLLAFMGEEAHSRYPVYTDTPDNVIGMVHIKDVLACCNHPPKKFNLRDVLRRVLFVAPTMPVLDLLLEMQRTHIHMALVVDEFGGIDGLVTIEDLIEEIVGEIDDEHDVAETAPLVVHDDGTVDALARTTIEDFEDRFGEVFTADERERIDTLGGLVFSLAGRIPERGAVIAHPSGLAFEVVDVDPRRIRRLRVHSLPSAATAPSGPGVA